MTCTEKKQNFDLIFEDIPIRGYENVYKVSSKKAKLQAIIAIHNTSLGMALGGIRIAPYSSFEQALNDVLRLSQGMTYKSAVAGVGFGGGKSVIIADPKTDKTEELLLAFGEAVNRLDGKYICAEDMGCTLADVKIIRKATPFVTGLPYVNSSGDPGRFTSFGVFKGIQCVVNKIYGKNSLKGKSIAIQGLGNVGAYLAEQLFWAGADLILSDIDEVKLEALARRYNAKTVLPSDIYKVECDVFAPCAMGAIINDDTIPQFKCKAIAGSANNQLLRLEHGDLLRSKNILYAPDFVINAGGLLNVACELDPEGYNPQKPREQTSGIYDSLLAVFEIAEKNEVSTHQAAISLADYRIRYGVGKRIIAPCFPKV